MSKKPGVVMLLQNFYPSIGGAERQALSLSRRLVDQGFWVTVVTQYQPKQKAFEMIEKVPVRRFGRGPVTFLFVSFIWLVLHKEQYDVIHVHMATSHAVGAAFIARLLGKKVIVKLSGSKLVGEVAVSRRTFIGRCKLAALGFLKPLLVLVSQGQEEDLPGSGLEKLQKRFIPNGVDIERFQPPTTEEKENIRKALKWDGLVFLFVGRFSADKLRLDVFRNFVTAWAQVKKEGHAMSFYLVGKGELEADYRRVIQEMGVESSVQLWPARDNVRELYQAANVFVLPSITEGLSNALLEAVSCGLPILASRVCGIMDIIQESVQGLLFDPLDARDIEQSLRRMVESKALREKMGGAARWVGQKYSLDETISKYVKLYEERFV